MKTGAEEPQTGATHASSGDLGTGILLALLGASAVFGAFRMPLPDRTPPLVGYLTYPGAVPLAAGLVVFLGGVAIGLGGWRNRRRPAVPIARAWRPVLSSVRLRRGGGVLLLILLYVACLAGRLLPFWAATYLYLALTMVWLRAGTIAGIIGISLGVAVLLEVVFGMALRLPLP